MQNVGDENIVTLQDCAMATTSLLKSTSSAGVKLLVIEYRTSSRLVSQPTLICSRHTAAAGRSFRDTELLTSCTTDEAVDRQDGGGKEELEGGADAERDADRVQGQGSLPRAVRQIQLQAAQC